ncbi:hypothetical protein TIFTF001_025171 [Ficus carica]|uniref:Uncharacterized protein n=1 Tax=Ficus carica TaxID=3494 RepID=A0AA88AJD7_FICCA|nr:hypothetical protein TIFTF001_025171 [Ficus carica]
MCINCFGNEEWWKKSKVYSENHSKNPAGYLGGSRSIVQHLEEVNNIHSSSDSNTSGGYSEVFKKTHWSESRGWTTERANEDYDQMIKIRDARLSEVPEESKLDSDAEEEFTLKFCQARGYESLQNEIREGKVRMADMEDHLKQQREVIQMLLQRLNMPSNHPGPNLPGNEDPPPPPAPAPVC